MYAHSRAEKRKVLQEIQQTKSHELVGTLPRECLDMVFGKYSWFLGKGSVGTSTFRGLSPQRVLHSPNDENKVCGVPF